MLRGSSHHWGEVCTPNSLDAFSLLKYNHPEKELKLEIIRPKYNHPEKERKLEIIRPNNVRS